VVDDKRHGDLVISLRLLAESVDGEVAEQMTVALQLALAFEHRAVDARLAVLRRLEHVRADEGQSGVARNHDLSSREKKGVHTNRQQHATRA
jgi:hypothetical protein